MELADNANLDSGYTNVSHPERWLSVVGGAALAAYGLTRRSLSGLLVAATGGMLVWRGATGHCMVYESLGINTAGGDRRDNVSVPYGKGIRVEKTVTVNATPEQLYAFWRNLENLPRFMSHLQSVQRIDDKRSHWCTKGPAGVDAEWDAEIINEVPNELIGWRSVDGSLINNAGSVHFTPRPHGTEVRVVLRYDPPAGKAGATLAKIFGEDADRQVEDDLRMFKQIIEGGTTARPTPESRASVR